MYKKRLNTIASQLFSCLLLITYGILGSIDGYAQSFDLDFGARSKGIGNANTTLHDAWAIFNNVAGISGVDKGKVVFRYDRYFNLDGFDKVGVAVIQPIGIGSLGLSALSLRDDLYSEKIISGAFANKIGFVQLGLRANYYQMRIDEFGTSTAIFIDFGGVVELKPELSFGAYISNLTASKLNNSEQTRLPVVMKIGVSYEPTKDILLVIDLVKDVDYDPIVRIGLEYKIVKDIHLRTGINTDPFKAYFGGGVSIGRFKVDNAVTSHEFLGMSHQLGVGFKYQK